MSPGGPRNTHIDAFLASRCDETCPNPASAKETSAMNPITPTTRKPRECRAFDRSGSDGTRTRDLRRDRTAKDWTTGANVAPEQGERETVATPLAPSSGRDLPESCAPVIPLHGGARLRLVYDSTAQERAADRAPDRPAPIDRPRLMTLDQAAADLARQLRGREVWNELDDITRQRYRHILSLMPDRGGAA